MTTLPKLIESIIQAVQEVNVDLIRNLEINSQILDRIGAAFSQISERRMFTFEEELAMEGGREEGVYSMVQSDG